VIVTGKMTTCGTEPVNPRLGVLSSRLGGRNGFDGIESLWEGVPGSELPLNDRKTRTANQQFAYAA
jgi:hypothetical protein